MTSQLRRLEIRQQELKTQCNRERIDLGEYINSLEMHLAWASKGLKVIRFFKKNSLLLIGVYPVLAKYKSKLEGKVVAVTRIARLLK